MEKELVIINKEKVYKKDSDFYCDNLDMKSIPEGLSKNIKVSIIAIKSKVKRNHKIGLKKIETTSNLFTFLYSIFKTFKKEKINYLLISITPYSFFAYLLLFIFRKKVTVYLRSNGYEEYKAILGFVGPLIYHAMYTLVTFRSDIITCQKRLVKKRSYNLVFPSEIDNKWTRNRTKPFISKPKLL